MNGWALVVAVAAAFYAYDAKEKAQEAYDLARDALYEAQAAKSKANDVADAIDR